MAPSGRQKPARKRSAAMAPASAGACASASSVRRTPADRRSRSFSAIKDAGGAVKADGNCESSVACCYRWVPYAGAKASVGTAPSRCLLAPGILRPVAQDSARPMKSLGGFQSCGNSLDPTRQALDRFGELVFLGLRAIAGETQQFLFCRSQLVGNQKRRHEKKTSIADLTDRMGNLVDTARQILAQLGDLAFLSVIAGNIVAAIVDDNMNLSHLRSPPRSSNVR